MVPQGLIVSTTDRNLKSLGFESHDHGIRDVQCGPERLRIRGSRGKAEGLDRVIHDRARLSVLTSLISNAKGLTLGDMLIPSLFVRELVQDRTNRAADVIQDISRQVGGSKPSLDRLLLFPTPSRRRILVTRQSTGCTLRFLHTPLLFSRLTTGERRRPLFKVLLFQVDRVVLHTGP